MRPDQADPAVDLVAAPALHLREQGRGQLLPVVAGRAVRAGRQLEGGLVGHRRLGAGRALGHRVVRRRDVRPERLHEGQAGREQLRAGAREVGVPHTEGGQRRVGAAALTSRDPGGLQQRVALLEHPVVVGADPGEARGPLDQQVVEEVPPLRRVTLDQGEVLGREQHRADQAQQLAGPGERGPVHPGLVGATGVDLHLEDRLAPVADHGRPDHGMVRTQAHQRAVAGDPVRGERRDVVDRLDQVGLALAVAADERRHPGAERDLGLRVGPEVVQREVRDVHGGAGLLVARWWAER